MENVILTQSFSFAVRIVKLCTSLANDKKEFVLSRQLMKCGTSIGANVREAQQAQSKKDFLSKISIALKRTVCFFLSRSGISQTSAGGYC